MIDVKTKEEAGCSQGVVCGLRTVVQVPSHGRLKCKWYVRPSPEGQAFGIVQHFFLGRESTLFDGEARPNPNKGVKRLGYFTKIGFVQFLSCGNLSK